MDMQAARSEQVAKLERLVMLEAQETDWANGAAESNGTLREMCLMNRRITADALAEARAEYAEFEEGLIRAEVAADLAALRANAADQERLDLCDGPGAEDAIQF